jgi:hypothetical protein
MGIGFWIRRLLGLSPRGVLSCDLCRTPIPARHLEKGQAVIIAQRRYCRGCVQEITQRGKGKPKGPSGGWTLAHQSSTVFLP